MAVVLPFPPLRHCLFAAPASAPALVLVVCAGLTFGESHCGFALGPRLAVALGVAEPVVVGPFAGTAGLTAKGSRRGGVQALAVTADIPDSYAAVVEDTGSHMRSAGSRWVAASPHIGRWGSPGGPVAASCSGGPCRTMALEVAITKYVRVCPSWLRRQ